MPLHPPQAGGPICWNAPESSPPSYVERSHRSRPPQNGHDPGFQCRSFSAFSHARKSPRGRSLRRHRTNRAPIDVMSRALDLLRELTEPMPREIFDWNPIQVAERMTTTDDFAWNAFAYTYNNYARDGFARTRLRFGNLISLEPNGPRLRSVLGGTGIALSSNCKNVMPPSTMRVSSRTAKRKENFTSMPADNLPIAPHGMNLRRTNYAADFSADTNYPGRSLRPPAVQRLCAIANQWWQCIAGSLRDGRDTKAVLEKIECALPGVTQNWLRGFQTN